MAEGKLIYEKEIAPNISIHAINALRESIEDAESVKRMLDFLSSYEFDVGGNHNFPFYSFENNF